jgi:hypothetical protein
MHEWEYEIWYLDPSRGTSSIRDELGGEAAKVGSWTQLR